MPLVLLKHTSPFCGSCLLLALLPRRRGRSERRGRVTRAALGQREARPPSAVATLALTSSNPTLQTLAGDPPD